MVKEMKPTDVYQLMKSDPNVHLIDVRSEQEYEQMHLEGGEHLPVDRIATGVAPSIAVAGEDPVVLLCHSGKRSLVAATFLERLGYSNCINVTGGLMAWQIAGLPVVDSSKG